MFDGVTCCQWAGTAAYRPAGACGLVPGFFFATHGVAFKAVRLRLTNRKLFEKSLTKNFYAPPPLPQARGRLVLPGHGRNFYAASRLCFLQQALIQFCNLFFAGIPRIAGEVNRRRRFTGRIPRSLRDFVFAGRKTGILSPMAFLAYSKLLYSWAISSSLVSLGLPGQQASA